MGSTSFTGLKGKAVSEKIVLAEINVGEELTAWALTGGQSNTYEIDYLNETVTLADDTTETIRKAISSIEEDGTALTARTSIATVEANAGSYWHDTATGKVYTHPTGSDDPDDHTMLGFFWLYFGTKGIVLNNHYYEPYLAESGVPHLRQSSPNLYWGVCYVGGGDLVLLNPRGFFDQISKNFIWMGKKTKLLIGGEDLPYSEYQTFFTGDITDKNFSRQNFRLTLDARTGEMMCTIPLNVFYSSNYSNLEADAIGKPIPYYYGKYDRRQAPIVTCIDNSNRSNLQYKICDHAIQDITNVYIDYGAGWQWVSHTSEDLTNGQFRINSTGYEEGHTRVKVAFQGKGSSNIIEGAPEIVEDLLISVLGYTTDRISGPAFTSSKGESDMLLNVAVEEEEHIIDVIEKICASDMAFFDEDGDGKFRYRTWRPDYPWLVGTYPEIKAYDILGVPDVVEDGKQIYPKVRIGYSYSYSQHGCLYREESEDDCEHKYGQKGTLALDTYLRNEGDAIVLAQRLNLFTESPTPKIDARFKLPVIDKTLGDKIEITMDRVPYGQAAGWDKQLFEVSAKDVSCFPFENRLEMFDLKDIGEYTGRWMATGAPNWAAASSSDRNVSGFWLGTSGYAASTDTASLNKSRWW